MSGEKVASGEGGKRPLVLGQVQVVVLLSRLPAKYASGGGMEGGLYTSFGEVYV